MKARKPAARGDTAALLLHTQGSRIGLSLPVIVIDAQNVSTTGEPCRADRCAVLVRLPDGDQRLIERRDIVLEGES
jgi:hypothetical protein